MLIAAGDRYDRLVGWGAVSTSLDGITWGEPVNPFDMRAKANGITHGPDKIVAISDYGWVSSAPPDLSHWQPYRIWQGNFSPQSVKYDTDLYGNNGIYMMVGQGKFPQADGPYSAGDEVGLIFTNTTGDDDTWNLIYGHLPDSRFYGIRRISTIEADVWIAVGSCKNKPIAIYSTNNGQDWIPIQLPTILPQNVDARYAYDVVYAQDLYWFALEGIVLYTPSLINPDWNAGPPIKFPYGLSDFRKIATNPAGHIVAAGTGGLAYTVDGAGWYQLVKPGYRFRSVIWYVDRWIASAESNLTTYTFWYSIDTINWFPGNNKIQAFDFVVI